MFTKKQIKEIEKLDVVKHFNTVIDSQYKRGTTSTQDNSLADIYDEATGGKVSRNFSCKTCVYNLYRNAGMLYRKSIEFYKQEQLNNLQKARDKAKENKLKNKEDGKQE